MKTIGLIGGMSWESSLEYYRIINEQVALRLGGLHSADCVMSSLDFGPVEAMLRAGDWDGITRVLAGHARSLEAGGAALVLIATNTMHHAAEGVQAAIEVPLLHIADATGAELRRSGVATAALLGTRFTMEMDFYHRRLRDSYGVATLVPDAAQREEINRIIFEELCRGRFLDRSRGALLDAIGELQRRGAQAVVLGCTELPLLVKPADSPLPVFDTMRLHALAAVEAALV